MGDIAKVQQLLTQGDGMFIASQGTKAGLHRQQLADFMKKGILERVERGVFISPDELDGVLFWMQYNTLRG